MAEATKEPTPFHGNRGVAGRHRTEMERFEITVSGYGGDAEKLAESVAKAAKGASKDVDRLRVEYREPGSPSNPRIRDMLADDDGGEDQAAEAAKQEKRREADVKKENEEAEKRGVRPMGTDENRSGAVSEDAKPASGSAKTTAAKKK